MTKVTAKYDERRCLSSIFVRFEQSIFFDEQFHGATHKQRHSRIGGGEYRVNLFYAAAATGRFQEE
jgi:hypothetical protein